MLIYFIKHSHQDYSPLILQYERHMQAYALVYDVWDILSTANHSSLGEMEEVKGRGRREREVRKEGEGRGEKVEKKGEEGREEEGKMLEALITIFESAYQWIYFRP